MCAVLIDLSLDFGLTPEAACTVTTAQTTAPAVATAKTADAVTTAQTADAVVYTVTIVDAFDAAALAAAINDPANQSELGLSSELSSATESTITIVSVEAAVVPVPSEEGEGSEEGEDIDATADGSDEGEDNEINDATGSGTADDDNDATADDDNDASADVAEAGEDDNMK